MTSAVTDPPRQPWLDDAAGVAAGLGTDPASGLTAAEAAARLGRVGPNRIQGAPPVPGWRRLLAQLADPLVVLLLVAVAISLVTWVVEGGESAPFEAIVISAILVANAVLGFVQEARAEEAVASLQKMVAATATAVRDGAEVRVPAEEVVPGDVLLLGEGDAVSADGRLVEAASLTVAEAALTGESEAVLKDAATLSGEVALGDRYNMVFAGTAVARGRGRVVVTSTGMATEMGRIAELLGRTEEEPTPLQREISHVGRQLGVAVLVIAAVVMGAILLTSDIREASDLVDVLLVGVSLAVAAVPEGLPAILSVVLALGVQRMARENAIVKNLSSVETLGSASVICSDKTGTLTRNEMTIQRVVCHSGVVEVTGTGYRPEGELLVDGRPLDERGDGALRDEVRVVLSGGSLASDATLRREGAGGSDGGTGGEGGDRDQGREGGDRDRDRDRADREEGGAGGRGGEWVVLGDPTEAAFLVAERKAGLAEARMARFRRVGEVPFTSERKLMSTLQADSIETGADGELVRVVTKGAPDVLLSRCTHERVGHDPRPLTDDRRAEILATVDELADEAFRTLAVAYRPLPGGVPAEVDEDVERELVFAGMVGIIDPPRAEARTAIDEAHRAGIRVIMITGDHPRTAARIAADLGVVGPGPGPAPGPGPDPGPGPEPDAGPGVRTVAGPDLDRLDEPQLRATVRTTSVYARVAPEHKLHIVDALQADGNIVAMTGDGVNDAPALKSADIGIAMGITGTDVTKQAGKMILADDNFATIVAAVREGRGIFSNIRKFLRYLLSSNVGEVLTMLLGVVLAGVIGLDDVGDTVAVPLLATQILWINLLTDAAPALAMGVDPPPDDVMARPPRRLTDRVIDAEMQAGVVFVGLVMALATLLTLDIGLPGGLVDGSDSLVEARTMAFTTLVLAQLFNCFNARSDRRSAFHHLFTNPVLWGAIGLSLLLQVAVVYTPFLHDAFDTTSLDAADWLLCAVMASTVLWADELRKLAAGLRRRRR